MNFAKGDRVVVVGPPLDVTGPAVPHFDKLIGTVTLVTTYHQRDCVQVHLDNDLNVIAQYGWITNNFTIPTDCVRPYAVSDEELIDVLASIQAAATNRATRKAAKHETVAPRRNNASITNSAEEAHTA